ncbi:LPS export ABC transporter permease LptG [Marinibactrum halimedae]|uniref:LPS export ABC transporter permease LptG n=1 Tax=Marinibactrum halimedae TaxID=1444977 RepID=A0AA37T942_9GAMM|nr:LPS export ABC transporter permease LptG [Marinibactrum halimedae]MCD9457953.1 LPS export ABC transporter permease LptG [Marinibactrum halimedae]GLS26216.1 LPS export ABC transporter permease LptG [Marinibactrum halimedae]
MRKLSRYVAKSVSGAIAVVMLVIVGLDVIAALVDELTQMSDDYGFLQILFYVGLTLPSRIYEFIPFSALIGCLIGLGLLAASSELVVMRAAGVSVRRITWLVLKPVLAFIGLGIVLGEFVTPITDQVAESSRSVALGKHRVLEANRGLWNREGNEFMHFNAVQPNGKLFGVTRYQYDDQQRLLVASSAVSAIYQGDHWIEENVVETLFKEDKTETATWPNRRWDNDLTPQVLNVLVLPPESLSISNLYQYATYREQQGLDSESHWLVFWKKIMQPLATASLVLVAISFIFGPLRQVTMGFRIFSGVMVGVIFRTTQDMLGPASLVYGFEPLIAVLAPIVICAMIGLYLLQKSR